MNEIAETLRKYFGGQEGIARNEESRSSPRGGMDDEREETETEDRKNNADQEGLG